MRQVFLQKQLKLDPVNFTFHQPVILEHTKFDKPNVLEENSATGEDREIIHCII